MRMPGKFPIYIFLGLLGVGGITLPPTVEAKHNKVDVDVYVDVDPPAPRVEPVPRARRGYVWVPGYWQWRPAARGYDWVPGHWERARRGYHYEPGHWERRPRGWVWVPPQWVRR